MKKLTSSVETQLLQHSFECLAPLFYFQVFSHPLTLEELAFYSQQQGVDATWLEQCLEQAVAQGLLCKSGPYFSLKDTAAWAEKREVNEQRAQQYLKNVVPYIKLMRRFPFVKGIFLSGSVSKGVIAEDGDIDYFIVTTPNRLWLSRTLLILFKKLCLFNSHRYFCINYLVDTTRLEIEEKNRFTATEVVTLLPVYEDPYYQTFWKLNNWIADYYPNASRRKPLFNEPMPASKIKKATEYLLGGWLGERLDILCMRLSVNYWQKKFKTMQPEHFKVAMKSRPYVSKHHPQNFQSKVLQDFQKNVAAFEKQWNVKLKRKG